MKICFAPIFAIAAFMPCADAGFVNPLSPSWRATAGTQYLGWENFVSAYGGANLPDVIGSNNLGALYNFGTGAVLTSTQNIYGTTGPLFISMLGGMATASKNPLEVVLNVSAAGSVIDLNSIALTLMDNGGGVLRLNPRLTEIRSDQPFSFGGRVQTLAFSWNLQPNLIAATQWQINISSTGPNTSLDAVSLDMNFIPTPGALSVLAMLCGVGVNCGRRRL